MLQPQKEPYFPFLNAMVAPQSGHNGILTFLVLHFEQVGIPILLYVVADKPHTAHFPTAISNHSVSRKKKGFILIELESFYLFARQQGFKFQEAHII